jgi:hypothetical protein
MIGQPVERALQVDRRVRQRGRGVATSSNSSILSGDPGGWGLAERVGKYDGSINFAYRIAAETINSN